MKEMTEGLNFVFEQGGTTANVTLITCVVCCHHLSACAAGCRRCGEFCITKNKNILIALCATLFFNATHFSNLCKDLGLYGKKI
jgi:hypothetical protein